jgi:hypothetical protein
MEDGRDMTVADITLAAFTVCNSARVVAYVPQITRTAVDRSGAQGISFTTWGIFLVSNVSATGYAFVNMNDWTMASMFLANTICCAAILALGAWKRAQHSGRAPGDSPGRSRNGLSANGGGRDPWGHDAYLP